MRFAKNNSTVIACVDPQLKVDSHECKAVVKTYGNFSHPRRTDDY